MAVSEAGFDKPSFSEHLAGLAPTLQQPAEKSGHYLSPEQLQLLEKLEYLTRYSAYIQIVLGATDSGKSTLLNQFLPEQDNELITCRIEPETELSRQELINSIYTQLGQSIELPQTQQSPEETIYTTARQLHEDDRLLLIVVDDAENLDDGALTWLLGESRVNLPDGQHLRLVLFAKPTLTQRLNSNRQLRETIEQHCHSLEIPPFDGSAVRAYVEHNYGNLAQTLTDEQWNSIMAASAGLPGRIAAALERIDRPSSNKTPKASNNFKWTALIMLAVLGLGLIAWLTPEYLLTEEESISVNLPIPAAETAPLSIREPVVIEPTPPTEPPTEPFTESEATTEYTETVSDAQVAELMDSLKEETPGSDKTGTDASEAETPSTSGKLALQLPPLATQQVLAESTEKTATPETSSTTTTQPATPQPATPQPATQTAVKTSAAPNTTTAKTATTRPEPAVTALSKPYLKEKQLLAWKPESYTLQMLGARQEKSVVEFIQSQSDYEKMYYFATEFKEKPWYVVVYGNYPDRQAAQAALRSLPAKLKQYKPWPRSAEGIQDDIHRVRP